MADSNDSTNTRLTELYDRYIADTATVEELREFWTLVKAMPDDHPLHQHVYGLYNKIAENASINVDWNRATEKIFATAKVYPMPVHRVHFLKRAWWKYAAAVIITAIGTAYLWNIQTKEKPSVATTTSNPVPVQNDALPGGNKATLTLADGKKIILDSAAKGEIAQQGNTRVQKTSDGLLLYDQGSAASNTSAVLLNTLVTPRGGQYVLTLPDGSQIWLNAESSITYPAAFTGKTREVSISGEAYFEVAKNKSKPFIVTAGNQTIEVLGTHFNVNTYKDEQTNNTTLLEGSVRIKTVHTSLTLKPGQQGQLNRRTNNLSLAVHPDLEQVMAWKNGLFNFNNADLQTVMKQLSRWYDVTVVYEGTVPQMKFGGKMQRSLNLSEVTAALSAVGVKFRIEGKKLIVTQ
jgi:ferric-dicitrate binding protein FerR (iron transport regulator)